MITEVALVAQHLLYTGLALQNIWDSRSAGTKVTLKS